MGRRTFGYMKDGPNPERAAFAARLNVICDDKKVPPKNQGRQLAVARIFRVSQKGARKWIEGEGYPNLDRCAEIARWGDVNFEWLMTGRGPKSRGEIFSSRSIAHVANRMEAMEPANQYLVVRLVDSVAGPQNGFNGEGN